MRFILTLVWYPEPGPTGTEGQFRTMDLEIDDPAFPRLPGVGEAFFFDDGGSATIEAVGWKLDGTPYLYLGKRLQRKGEGYDQWSSRGFMDRHPLPAPTPPAAAPPLAAPSPAAVPAPPAPAPAPPAPAGPTTPLPPAPGIEEPPPPPVR